MPKQKTGIAWVALAAALWGTDALFRRGLALELPAATVVFFEHIVLVALTLPWLLRSWRIVAKLGAGDLVALFLIGAGASATATILFTAAFSYGDPNTPLLLQKLQPLVAVLGARLLLGEALLSRYWLFLVAGLGGAYLIAFPDPLQVSVTQLAPALLAVGAAALWGLGTVFGRRLSARLEFRDLTAWRFAIGMPVAGLIWILQAGASGRGFRRPGRAGHHRAGSRSRLGRNADLLPGIVPHSRFGGDHCRIGVPAVGRRGQLCRVRCRPDFVAVDWGCWSWREQSRG